MMDRPRDFKNEVVDDNLLDSSIEWMRVNLEPSDVFEDARLIEYVVEYFPPEEVYTVRELTSWAEENGLCS